MKRATEMNGNRPVINTIINFVPQQEAWIIERMGRYLKTLNPGLNILAPIIDKIRYRQTLKEIVIDVAAQSAITKDNVTVVLDGILFAKIFDPYLASYGVDNPIHALSELAQTAMRSEIGKIQLDDVIKERDNLNTLIIESINKASASWGINCLRYEIKDVKLPSGVQNAMQMQVEAERKKRALILESEGLKEASINKALGEKQSSILISEARQLEQINQARGEADALQKIAQAKADSIKILANSLMLEKGEQAASLFLAQQYITEFGNLAKKTNTVIMSQEISDISAMVAKASSIYKSVTTNHAAQ